MAHHPNLPRALRSAQVLVRFGLRLLIIVGFASFGTVGFSRGFGVLLWMSSILCAVAAIIKRERPFDVLLNHWDEAVAYAALFCLARGLQSIPA